MNSRKTQPRFVRPRADNILPLPLPRSFLRSGVWRLSSSSGWLNALRSMGREYCRRMHYIHLFGWRRYVHGPVPKLKDAIYR